MQNQRGSGYPRDPFSMFGGLGSFGGFGGSIFGRNPFDDPFFTRPFGGVLDHSNPVGESLPPIQQSEPVIRELGSDDEEEMATDGEEGLKSSSPNNGPFVDHPDDETEGNYLRGSHILKKSRFVCLSPSRRNSLIELFEWTQSCVGFR